MLRTTLACLVAIAVPAAAQNAGPRSPRGPENRPQQNRLERTLKEILKRLDRLEKRMDAKPPAPAIDSVRLLKTLPLRTYKVEAFAPKKPVGAMRVLINPKHKIKTDVRVERERGHDRDMRRGDDRRREHRRPHPRHRPDDRRHRRSHGPRERDGAGHPMQGMHRIMQAARKGDPRARQMLTRLRHAIDQVLGSDKNTQKRAHKGAPLTFGFKPAKPALIPYGAFKLEGDALRVRAAELDRLKLHVVAQRARVDALDKSKAVRAMKLRELERMNKTAMAKKQRAVEASRKIAKLRTEMARVQAELNRLKKELARSK